MILNKYITKTVVRGIKQSLKKSNAALYNSGTEVNEPDPSHLIKDGSICHAIENTLKSLIITDEPLYEKLHTKTCTVKKVKLNTDTVTKEQLIEILEVPDTDLHKFELIYKNLEIKEDSSLSLLNVLANMFDKKLVRTQILSRKKPVVCIMGHVDHGKTTLLDYYRKSAVADREAGGITQKIGGFTLSTPKGPISFIDTPGHELFTNMRETGINCADIIVMIVSATEGVKPQTREVFDLIQKNHLPYIVVINKIDLPQADVEAVEEELVEMGIDLEYYGGDVPCVHISAKTGENLDLLLDLISEESERIDLSADIENQPELRVIESKSKDDKDLCKTTVVVKNGILKIGQPLSFKGNWFKLMAMKCSSGFKQEIAEPGDIVEIIGINKLPQSAETIIGHESEKYCKLYTTITDKLNNLLKVDCSNSKDEPKVKLKYKTRREKRRAYGGEKMMVSKMEATRDEILAELRDDDLRETEREKKVNSLLELNRQLNELRQNDEQKHLIIKASDIGTVQTIRNFIDGLPKMNINLAILDCGDMTTTEIEMAVELGATVMMFDLPVTGELMQAVKDHELEVLNYSIIYKLFEKFERMNTEFENNFENLNINMLGAGTVLKTFKLKNDENEFVKVCGAKVENGYFQKNAKFKLIRNGMSIKDGLTIESLKRFKKNIDRAEEGQELGIFFEGYSNFEEGDRIECYF